MTRLVPVAILVLAASATAHTPTQAQVAARHSADLARGLPAPVAALVVTRRADHIEVRSLIAKAWLERNPTRRRDLKRAKHLGRVLAVARLDRHKLKSKVVKTRRVADGLWLHIRVGPVKAASPVELEFSPAVAPTLAVVSNGSLPFPVRTETLLKGRLMIPPLPTTLPTRKPAENPGRGTS